MKRYIKSAVVSYKDEDDNTKYTIARYTTRPDQLAELADSDSYIVRKEIARNPNTPADTLRELSHDSAGYYIVGKNPNAPVEVLWEYAKDTEDCDRWVSVVDNPNCPAEILDYLIYEPYVQFQVVGHPNVSPDTLKQLIANPYRYNVFDNGEDEGNEVLDKAKQRLAQLGDSIPE